MHNRNKKLVLNNASVVSGSNIFNRLFNTFNKKGDVVIREEKLENRDHWVVPMVMAVEGVLNGSLGPLYYPEEELAKNVSAWNHKPIIVYHPSVDKSGCDPEIINNQKIGVILNTKYEGNKLKAEAWIEKERATNVDQRVVDAILNKTIMELSTGLQVDVEPTKGVWNTKNYVGVARNYVPDHLAVLPDEIGASSIADGAGFVRNSEGKDITKKVDRMLKAYGLTFNELSHDDIRRGIQESLHTTLKGIENDNLKAYGFEAKPERKYFDFWIVEVYGDYFIYETCCNYYKLMYTKENDTILVSGTPQEVQRKISYEVKASNVTNKKNKKMDRKEKVDALITNGQYKEADREMLMGLTDEQFTTVHNHATKATMNYAKGADEEDDSEDGKKDKMAKNTQSVDEYIASAPQEIQAVLNEGRNALNKQKEELIAVITANSNNVFTKESLENKAIDELRGIAALAKVVSNSNQEQQERRIAANLGEGASAHNSGNVQNQGLVIPSTYEEAK